MTQDDRRGSWRRSGRPIPTDFCVGRTEGHSGTDSRLGTAKAEPGWRGHCNKATCIAGAHPDALTCWCQSSGVLRNTPFPPFRLVVSSAFPLDGVHATRPLRSSCKRYLSALCGWPRAPVRTHAGPLPPSVTPLSAFGGSARDRPRTVGGGGGGCFTPPPPADPKSREITPVPSPPEFHLTTQHLGGRGVPDNPLPLQTHSLPFSDWAKVCSRPSAKTFSLAASAAQPMPGGIAHRVRSPRSCRAHPRSRVSGHPAVHRGGRAALVQS